MNHNEITATNVHKANMIFSDYAMATDPVEKDAFLEVLSTYVERLNDPKIKLIYSKVCDSSQTDKVLYEEILEDLLIDLLIECEGEN